MSTIIKHKEFTNHKIFKSEVAGRPLTIDVGKVAELASASAMVTYGETTVLVAVTCSARPRDRVVRCLHVILTAYLAARLKREAEALLAELA